MRSESAAEDSTTVTKKLTPSRRRSANSTISTADKSKQAAVQTSFFGEEPGSPFLKRLEAYYVDSAKSDTQIKTLLLETQTQIRQIFAHPPGPREPGLRNPVLKAEEVCSIIESCKHAGVSVLKFRGLELRFGQADQVRAEHPPAPTETAAPDSSLPATDNEISAQSAEANERSLMRDELNVRTRQIDELPITDPLEHERLLASGELEDDESDPAGEEA